MYISPSPILSPLLTSPHLHPPSPLSNNYHIISLSPSFLPSIPPSSQILSGVMLEVLAEDFPEYFTAEVQMVWTKLMALIFWHLAGAYTEVGWVQVSSSAV